MPTRRLLPILLALLALSGALPEGAVPAPVALAGTPPFENAEAIGTAITTTVALAWGDVDNDGDLDLAVGNRDQLSQLYRNNGGALTLDPSWTSSVTQTSSLAWGDVDNDGDLDLVLGNYRQPSQLYRNNGGTLTLDAWAPDAANTESVAWSDVDNDGDLDLVLGNFNQPSQLYRNNGGALTLDAWAPDAANTESVAWGDVDKDGDLDLVMGNSNQPNQLYRNANGILALDASWQPDSLRTSDVALGDINGDGFPELVVGQPGINQLYRNVNGAFVLDDSWKAEGDITSVTFGDLEGDGDLDLVLGGQHRSFLYRNENGTLTLDTNWQPNAQTLSAAWGDVDNDGDLDLAFGNLSERLQLYRNVSSTLPPTPSWVAPANASSAAWGDVDNDGDLDLMLGGSNQLYSNDGGVLTLATSLQPTDSRSVAWGDVDNDGDLDLALGNFNQPSQIYRNNGGVLTLDTSWQPESAKTTALAWGDVDGDGDLDLVMGNDSQSSRLYRNENGVLKLDTSWTTEGGFTSSLAWGDVDNDGNLDLVIGRNAYTAYDPPTQLYRNVKGILTLDTSWSPVAAQTQSLAWGDVDNDGDLDLAVGNNGPNQLYRNEGGTLTVDASWNPAPVYTRSVAWGDVDNDGDLDLVVAYNTQYQLYRNVHGALRLDPAWAPAVSDSYGSVALGDVDNDGTLDLIIGNQVYRSPHRNPAALPLVRVGLPLATPSLAGATGYGIANVLDGAQIAMPYTLTKADGRPVARVVGQYSLNGGGDWRPAVATADTQTTNLAASPGGTPHTYTWSTLDSGLFGRSDNVVFRLLVLPDLRPRAGAIPGPFLFASGASATLPFRLRGTQVRVQTAALPPATQVSPTQTQRVLLPFVAGGYGGSAAAVRANGAIVYRLPKDQAQGAQPYRPAPGAPPYQTDGLGFLPGHGEIALGDRLVALQQIGQGDKYTLYLTSAAPTANGLNAFTVRASGVQNLTVSPDNRLVLFNLSVSLEWDARRDAQFISQLRSDLQRASELLYDWSDGQVALGQLTIYQNKEHWADADIRVYATNRLRPNATQGGITRTDLNDPSAPGTVYERGQVRIGASWSRFADPGQTFAEDWPRALAHELGHYALFLDEDYLGLNAQGALVPVETCPSPMSDPYRDDYGEFRSDADWLPACKDTLSNRTTGRSDWATIKTFYDQPPLGFNLRQPARFGANPGPTVLPLAVTTFSEVTPAAPNTTLPLPFVGLSDSQGGRYVPGDGARAFLFNEAGDRITDLGEPVDSQVRVRGLHAGDRLCVFDPGKALGCNVFAPGDSGLRMADAPNWRPEVQITPVTSRTLSISVPEASVGAPPPATLTARLFPLDDSGSGAVASTTLIRANGQYGGTFTLSQPALEGYVQISTGGDAPREAVADYALGGNPAPPRRPPRRSRRKAPAISSDGQLILFADGLDFKPGEFFSIQTATSLPSVPAWATVLGQGYRLLASPGAPALGGVSLNMSYAESDAPLGEEENIRIYFWDGKTWTPLDTVLDTGHNEASARAQPVPGIYALMTSGAVPLPSVGWNLVYYYPGASQPLPQAFASISGRYTTVYGYDESDGADPWKVYDVGVPAWVNDLTGVEFGQGYWINVTSPTTLLVKGAERQAAGSAGILSAPPATYYGVLAGRQPGLPVVARVGVTVCGSAQTRQVGGQVVFSIDVAAAGVGELAGCGLPGAPVTITVGGSALPGVPAWDNNRPRGI